MSHPPEVEQADVAQLRLELADPDPGVRLRALGVVLAKPTLAKELFACVVDDQDPDVRARLIHVALVAQSCIAPELIVRLLTTELTSHVHKRRFRAVGLLHFLDTVDIGYFLVRAAKDKQLATRKSVLDTLCARLSVISEPDVHRILAAQLQSPEWQHRLLGLQCLAREPTLLTGRYLALCAAEHQPRVRKLMFALVERCASTLSAAELEAIFVPELVSHDWKQRMAAVGMLRTLAPVAAEPLLKMALNDSIGAVRDMAQRALKLSPLK